MSVANSLISVSVASQAAQIATLTSQVAALTTGVSDNAAQISLLVAGTDQAFVVKSVVDSGQAFNSGEQEVLFEDAPEVGISGKYSFKISGLIQSDGQPLRGVVYFSNTAAGALYEYGVEATSSNELTFSYTGFLEYVVGQPLPKISMTGVMTSGLWGYANISLTFYRVQKIANP